MTSRQHRWEQGHAPLQLPQDIARQLHARSRRRGRANSWRAILCCSFGPTPGNSRMAQRSCPAMTATPKAKAPRR